MSAPVVSVVIPTVGRPELSRAIDSVLRQTVADEVQVIVVSDQPEGTLVRPTALRSQDRLVSTGGGRGGGFARNLGVTNAEGEWVAFLDDDDEWMAQKLECQLDAARRELAAGRTPLIASRHIQVDNKTARASGAIPLRPYRGNGSVAEYLFRRRRPSGGRASIYTSTLFVGTDTAAACRWDDALKRHQDWDWLVRLQRDCGVSITQLAEPLAKIHTGSSGSISAKSDWASSLDWADRVLTQEDPHVYVDFIAAQSLRYAVAARSLPGIAAVAKRILRSRRVPSIGGFVIAVGGLIPRSRIERLMTRFR